MTEKNDATSDFDEKESVLNVKPGVNKRLGIPTEKPIIRPARTSPRVGEKVQAKNQKKNIMDSGGRTFNGKKHLEYILNRVDMFQNKLERKPEKPREPTEIERRMKELFGRKTKTKTLETMKDNEVKKDETLMERIAMGGNKIKLMINHK